MMRQMSLFTCTVCILLAACTKSSTSEEMQIPAPGTVLAAKAKAPKQDLVFTEQNLFPEGVVYDKFNNRFYVSSTTRGDIGIVSTNGTYSPFITDPALIATAGLEIDEARKRLYTANATAGTVGIFDINTGERVAIVDLNALLPNSGAIFINDLALDPQGNAYVTNSFAPVIYKITPEGDASIYYQNQTFAVQGFGFNGIVYAPQGFLLVAHTARNEVIKFPVKDPSAYEVVALDASLNRPDGLLLNNNGKELLVVNNAGGQNGKVISFTSQDKWQTATATGIFETGPVFPTTATTAGKQVYVLYAYLNRALAGQAEFTIKQIPGIEKF